MIAYSYYFNILDIKIINLYSIFVFEFFLQQQNRTKVVMKTMIITRTIPHTTIISIMKYCHQERWSAGFLIESSGLGCLRRYSIHQAARSTGCIGWSITRLLKRLIAFWYLREMDTYCSDNLFSQYKSNVIIHYVNIIQPS